MENQEQINLHPSVQHDVLISEKLCGDGHLCLLIGTPIFEGMTYIEWN